VLICNKVRTRKGATDAATAAAARFGCFLLAGLRSTLSLASARMTSEYLVLWTFGLSGRCLRCLLCLGARPDDDPKEKAKGYKVTGYMKVVAMCAGVWGKR